MTRRPDLATLSGGLAIAALGAVLLLDRTGTLRLRFGSLAPLVVAVTGIVLLGAGPGHRRRGRAIRSGSWPVAAGVGCLTLAALLTARELGLWWSDAVVWPVVLALSGGALLWRQGTGPPPEPKPPTRPRPRPAADAVTRDPAAPAAPGIPGAPDQRQGLSGVYQGGFGVALVVGAALLFLQANGALTGARDLVLSIVVVGLGLGLVLAPLWVRLARGLARERAERIRSQERAEVAAHLHDSVLQTLALVQKRSDDPRAVATIARRQERELRAWLNGAPAARPDASLADALRAAAAEIEERLGVPIDVVAVGDRPLDERTRALVAAAREAMANAARHGAPAPGADATISLYLEARADRVEAFVRDRGAGFDPGSVPGDRQGVRESIVGRMARHGGRAVIHSAPGSGTEVELVLEDLR